MEHNFKTVDYGFPTLNGEEIKGVDCCLSDQGASVGNIGHGPMFGNTDQTHEQARVNARRIAACINYCTDITTEELIGRKVRRP